MKQLKFSAACRASILQQMEAEQLDVLVIGGGITGCGIALDAALRGINVGLVEMQDFGAGTSSRSTKLIHGGLRYLKQGELKLVQEVGRERAILHQLAPHLVIPEPMLLPIIQGGTYGKWATSIGLWIYDRLAGVKRSEQRKMLSKQKTLEKEPLLRQSDLKGGGYYYEYRTDDARLTIEVVKTAVAKGAKAVNYTRLERYLYDQGHICGAEVIDLCTNQIYRLKANKVINATGPWVDQLRDLDGSLTEKRLHLTKGVHIVVDHQRFPLQQAVYFDVADGRMVFAIPRENKTYIGTTDTDYQGNLENPSISQEDISYLLEASNQMFPSIELQEEDIESYWVGLRPLIHEDGKSPSELSRKDEILRSPSGLLSIAGGKLTGYRKMAERVMDVMMAELAKEKDLPYVASQTMQQKLSGGQIKDKLSWAQFYHQHTSLLQTYGCTPSDAAILVHRYGSNLEKVLSYLPQADEWSVRLGQSTSLSDSLLIAQLLYTLEEEMVLTVEDFLTRRLSLSLFNVSMAKQIQPFIQEVMTQS